MNEEEILYSLFLNGQLTLSEYLKSLNTNNVEELRKLINDKNNMDISNILYNPKGIIRESLEKDLSTPLDWNELTMKEKAAYIRMGVANGYKDIDSIKEVYNEFKCGGNLYKEGGPKKQEYIYDVLPRLLKEAGLNIRVTSGYRKPGAVGTAGNRSWHPRHGAVDIVPIGKTTFEDIEEVLHTNPTIVKYMLDNGFGLLDESGRSLASRDTMKRTGATGAHFHIGRDSKPAALYKQRVVLYSPMATTDNRKVYFSNPHLPIPEDLPQPKQVVSIQTPAKPLLNTTLDSNVPTNLIVMQLEEPVVDKLIPEVVVTALAPRRYSMPNPQELLALMNSMMVPYELPEVPKPVTATERLAQLNLDKNSLLLQDLENSILRANRLGTPLDEVKLARDVKDLQFYRNMAANGGNLFLIGGPKGRLAITNLSPWDEMAALLPIAYTLGKLLDPTGITGYSDTKEAWKEFKNKPALNTGYNAVMETLGSLPVIGGKGKILKTIQGLVTGQGALNDWNHAKEMQNAYNKELVVDYWDNTVKPRGEAYKHNEQIKKKMSYTEVNHLPAFSLAPKGTKVGDILPNYNVNNALIEKYKNKHAFGGPLVDIINKYADGGLLDWLKQVFGQSIENSGTRVKVSKDSNGNYTFNGRKPAEGYTYYDPKTQNTYKFVNGRRTLLKLGEASKNSIRTYDISKNIEHDKNIAKLTGWEGISEGELLNGLNREKVYRNVNPESRVSIDNVIADGIKYGLDYHNWSGKRQHGSKGDEALFSRHLGKERNLEEMPITGIRFFGDYNSDGSYRLPNAEYTGIPNYAKRAISRGITEGSIDVDPTGEWTQVEENAFVHPKELTQYKNFSIRENNDSGIYDVFDTYDFPDKWWLPDLNRPDGKLIEVRDTIWGPNAIPELYNPSYTKLNISPVSILLNKAFYKK